MAPRWRLIGIVGTVAAALAALFVWYSLGDKPVMRISPLTQDLGKVKEGEDLVASFDFRNEGRHPLDVFDVKTDCGCTDLSWKSARLAPGGSAKLTVHIDTTMKQGPVTKQIRLASSDKDFSFAALEMKVQVENLHDMMTESGKAKIFTDEKCAHCHVDNGVGAFGKALFEADCAMCHRRQAESNILVARELEKGVYTDAAYIAHVADVIANGSKTHRSMPGFLDKAGGPLTKEQVKSLVDYLKSAK